MQADSPKRPGHLILIVDDEPSMRDLRRECLEREGYRVVEAENGREGVAAAIRERPRLILMNYLMPEMNGLEATRQIRREPGLEGLPILMNSACSEESTRDGALLAGCNDYLHEPCSHRRLMEKITTHLPPG
jgi:CheY-like chemotaxis protein